MRAFSSRAEREGYSPDVTQGLSLWGLLLLGRRGSGAHGLPSLLHVGSEVAAPGPQSTSSVAVAHALSCPEACGIFADQGLNPCLMH